MFPVDASRGEAPSWPSSACVFYLSIQALNPDSQLRHNQSLPAQQWSPQVVCMIPSQAPRSPSTSGALVVLFSLTNTRPWSILRQGLWPTAIHGVIRLRSCDKGKQGFRPRQLIRRIHLVCISVQYISVPCYELRYSRPEINSDPSMMGEWIRTE